MDNEKFIEGLCPRGWDNTDVSELTEKQVNTILDNCELCNRYPQCQKVAELDRRLKYIENGDVETVQDLIDLLDDLSDREKALPIRVFNPQTSALSQISIVDNDLSDRVDLNIKSNEPKLGFCVSKMIFIEKREIQADVYEFLDRQQVIEYTDYGNTEISGELFIDLISRFNTLTAEELRKADGDTITLKEIEEGLGTDVANALLNVQIDFIQII